MTTTDLPPIPDGVDAADTIRYVNDHAPRTFLWDYQRSRPQLVTLYNKAMASQWNSVTDLDWSTDVDSEAVLYFIRTVGLGLLVQRAAGSKAPDAAGWADLIGRILASIGAPPTAPPTTVDTRLRRDF